MKRFIIKKNLSKKPLPMMVKYEKKENNVEKKIEDMDTQEKIKVAMEILDQPEVASKVKKVRKDKGLIERTESSKIILTEDNKELLND
jgi:hypothetical protein